MIQVLYGLNKKDVFIRHHLEVLVGRLCYPGTKPVQLFSPAYSRGEQATDYSFIFNRNK